MANPGPENATTVRVEQQLLLTLRGFQSWATHDSARTALELAASGAGLT